jgi:arylsulfatase A-like enzyme
MVIDRRDFLKAATIPAAAGQIAGQASRPNILFLIADDWTFRGVRGLGNAEIETPTIDGLMRRGCTFTHCFHQGSWSGAVCVPSRTMLNSGLTTFRAQKEFEQTPLWGQTLGAAGYDTTIVGKWHLSKTALGRSFREQGPVHMSGMFESGPEAYNRPAPGNSWRPWDSSLKGQWLRTREWGHPDGPDEVRHAAAVFADAAIERLQRAASRTNPFFLYVGFTSPHDPRQSPREFVERYPREKVTLPPSYLGEHPFDQGDARLRDELLAPFPRTREAVQVHRAEYYAHITYLDTQVGRILEGLEKTGKASETIVVLTSDHGLAVGEHGLMGKQNLYEHSVRVPYVIAGPGIPKGKKIDSLVYQHSTFATTCELAGVAVPKTVEFPSLVETMRNGGEPHDAVFCWYRDFQRSVRTREHKLIVYPQAGITQLFDLRKDPWETADVAGEDRYARAKTELMARLRRFQGELGDSLRVG